MQQLHLTDLIGISSTAIVEACVADPYLLLQLSSGNAILLRADAAHGELTMMRRSSISTNNNSSSHLLSLCSYSGREFVYDD